MTPERQRVQASGKLYADPSGPSPSISSLSKPRAVVVEEHPAVRAVLEHWLCREGYEVDCWHEVRIAESKPGPALMLIGAGERGGLYIFESCDAAETLEDLRNRSEPQREPWASAVGIHVFIPQPFGIADVLRIVRAVGSFDGRKCNGREASHFG